MMETEYNVPTEVEELLQKQNPEYHIRVQYGSKTNGCRTYVTDKSLLKIEAKPDPSYPPMEG